MANKNSAARIKANNKYNAKAYDRIGIAVHKGKKDVIKAHAAEQGETINAFVTRAIDETIERDNAGKADKEKSPASSAPE